MLFEQLKDYIMEYRYLFIFLFLLNNNLFAMQTISEKRPIYQNIEQEEPSDTESHQALLFNRLREIRQELNDLTGEHESVSQQISSLDKKISQPAQYYKDMLSEKISANLSGIILGAPLAITGGYYFFALFSKSICMRKAIPGFAALIAIAALTLTKSRYNHNKNSDNILYIERQELIERQKELDQKIEAMYTLLNKAYGVEILS